MPRIGEKLFAFGGALVAVLVSCYVNSIEAFGNSRNKEVAVVNIVQPFPIKNLLRISYVSVV